MAEKAQRKKIARREARKVRDKWKAKQWYIVRAPKMYNLVPVAETLSDETDKLMGRVATATLQDLTGDFSKMHVKLHFKVNGVKGNDCSTKFVGHELTSDYVRRLTRRRHTKIDAVFDVETKDGWKVRVKPMGITEKRAKSSQAAAIRHLAEDVARKKAGTSDVATFVRDTVSGDLALEIYKQARAIYPLKRVEIRKSEILAEPEGWYDETEAFPEPGQEPENQPAEGEEPEAEESTEEATEETEAEAEEPAEEAAEEPEAEESASEEEPAEEPEAAEAEETSDEELTEEERVNE